MIIGLCGLIGSGKNTVAEHLIQEHAFYGVSFAEPLKDATACIFGWDRDMLEGATSSDRQLREQKDEWWSQRLGFDVSPRYMLQYLGTEVMRGNLHQDIWVCATENRLLDMQKDYPILNFVISDVRFPNEVDMIKRLGGVIWHVRRGDLPDWFGQDPKHIHASETAWNNTSFDVIIYNDGSIDELKEVIDNWVNVR